SLRVIQAGFVIAFFAGEVEWGGMVARAGGGLAVAEGEAGDGFADGAVVSGAHAFGAEPVDVAEVGGAAVFEEMAGADIDVALPKAGGEPLQHAAGLVVGELRGSGRVAAASGSGGFLHAVAIGVVDVGCSVAAVHREDVIFGVIGVVVGAVVEEVAGSVVGVAVHAVVVLRRARIVAGEGGVERLRAGLVPAVAETVVGVGIRRSAAGGS